MSCLINDGIKRGCKSTGGLYTAYVMNYPSGTTDPSEFLTYDASGKVTGFSGALSGATAYQFEFNKNSADFNEEYQVNVENMSYGFNQKFEGMYAEMTQEKQNLVSELMGANLLVIVKDKNNRFFLMGQYNGAYLGGGSAGSGKALSDLNGYTLTFQAEEGTAAPEVDAAALGDLVIA